MIAALPMYDMGPLRPAHDRLWQAIRASLGFGPAALTRDADPWALWRAPDLLLAQTCGLPYRARLHGHVTLVGTPDYRLPGCPPGHYRSVLVARADDPRATPADFAGAPFAYNEPLSQSGWAALHAHFAALGLPLGPGFRTGAHAASARTVADRRAATADIAAIDAQTWRLLQTHEPALTARLKPVGHTAPTPGLPLVTANTRDPAPIAAAIRAAIARTAPDDRAALHLHALVPIPAATYLALPTPPPPL